MLESDAGSGGATPPSLLSGLPGLADATRDAISAQAHMAAEYASFTKFRKRIDGLIRDLKGSDAGSAKVGESRLARHQFGGGGGSWSEAAGLFTAYQTVISELETLSKLLSDSMEGMGIVVLASHKGYENIDADIRHRMAAIDVETTKHYGGEYDPSLPEKTREKADGGGAETGPTHAAHPPKAAGGEI
ncbi:hypothetical protein [Streptomyces tropicalis]|uniref:Uncharacterized protein n=1 Tax=Streptomyces tropicalis TaxID=3034234 RepID=A0ABT6A953_9ACTN|nr:hypothetical protein [Streptomyces tropicalis]MDF3301178.1 hypothetical protein [Streptomyces tropicalis]